MTTTTTMPTTTMPTTTMPTTTMPTAPTTLPTTPQPKGPFDPIFGLQEKVASLLIPIFKTADTDEFFAYQIACRSLEAYEPETRADFLNIGRTIAFSLAAMALLGDAADPAMQLDDKKRILVHATALNRSADQAERSMMERRRYQRAYPTLPAHVAPPNDAHIQAQAVATQSAAPTPPAKPEINLEPPPSQTSAMSYGAPNRVTTPPNQMFHAVNQHSPAPHLTPSAAVSP